MTKETVETLEWQEVISNWADKDPRVQSLPLVEKSQVVDLLIFLLTRETEETTGHQSQVTKEKLIETNY